MRLVSARVTKYRSIDDSTEVPIDEAVTCLIGKNESGKTNFLKALFALNPIGKSDFDVDFDYPKPEWADYKHTHKEEPAVAVAVTFELDHEEIAELKKEFGADTVSTYRFIASKNYVNKVNLDVDCSEAAGVQHFIKTATLPSESARQEALKIASTVEDTEKALKSHADAAVQGIAAALRKRFESTVRNAVIKWLWERAPKFVYFSDYEFMPGTASIPMLQEKQKANSLEPGEVALLRLIAKAGLTLAELRDRTKFERHIANLEGAASAITRDVFQYWTQNKNLKVRILTSDAEEGTPALAQGPLIRIRIENTRHDVTVPFDERSRGFVWFFSFLAYFHELEKSAKTQLILLLDEPGLALHATAQSDLLRFIEERLAPPHQVLYTTHSPFMIDAKRLQRARTVEDVAEAGTQVSKDVLRNERDTVFPLQAALGLEITQTLFVGPHNLLVEGPSEVLYLPVISEILASRGTAPLDPRWTLTPIGGIDKASSFVSLFGASKLHIAILMDYASHQKQTRESLERLVGADHVIPLNRFRDGKETDIEDIFEPEDYVSIVNAAYRRDLRADISLADLSHEHPRIVKRLEHYFEAHNVAGGKFSHLKVANSLAESKVDVTISDATLKRFAAVYEAANALLGGDHPQTTPGRRTAKAKATP